VNWWPGVHASHHHRPRSPQALSLCQGRRSVPDYRTIDALDGLSFNVSPCERVAVIGPNGAGKSTLLKIRTGNSGSSRCRLDAPTRRRNQ
jgi:ABC-type uncharacterized transport system ATPase subunit